VWNSEIAEIETGGSKRTITVSTVQEAEVFASNGYDDIIFAAHFGPDKISRLVKLAVITDVIYIYIYIYISFNLNLWLE